MKVKKEAIASAKLLPALSADFITTAQALNAQKTETALEEYKQAVGALVVRIQQVVDEVARWEE